MKSVIEKLRELNEKLVSVPSPLCFHNSKNSSICVPSYNEFICAVSPSTNFCRIIGKQRDVLPLSRSRENRKMAACAPRNAYDRVNGYARSRLTVKTLQMRYRLTKKPNENDF